MARSTQSSQAWSDRLKLKRGTDTTNKKPNGGATNRMYIISNTMVSFSPFLPCSLFLMTTPILSSICPCPCLWCGQQRSTPNSQTDWGFSFLLQYAASCCVFFCCSVVLTSAVVKWRLHSNRPCCTGTSSASTHGATGLVIHCPLGFGCSLAAYLLLCFSASSSAWCIGFG